MIVQGIDYQWEADLADVQNLSESNNGIKYLLVIVDVFFSIFVGETPERQESSVNHRCV